MRTILSPHNPSDLATATQLRPRLYDHYQNVPLESLDVSSGDSGRDYFWNVERWGNFSPAELSCPHCGEFYYDAIAFDTLQGLRDSMGAPLIINSAHRCMEHNQSVGGRPNSAHLKIAFDIAISGHDPRHLYTMARRVGFTNFGFYQTFLHVDLRPPVAGNYRRWVASGVDMSLWQETPSSKHKETSS